MTRDGVTFPDIEQEIDQLLHPSRFYARPTDVVVGQLLTVDERRAILSTWASVARWSPTRLCGNHLTRKRPVTFDEIMDALMQLDRLKGSSRAPMAALLPSSQGAIFGLTPPPLMRPAPARLVKVEGV